MKEGGVKESGSTRVKDIKHSVSENVSLRRRIEALEKPLYEIREKVYSLESEIKKVKEYIGMSE
ncbi:hypothetical protein ES695_16010 [Candidatus Atribacteria bacterium 1244-E10-H5-B2]|nr:MAG: hypothetical protein ES695_16010 [Candidatus Atribacteria bacterium 1244-E10-H5-B2]